MIQCLELQVEKHRGDGMPHSMPAVRWYEPEMPSRTEFFAEVERIYEMIELPWFPYSACAFIATETEPMAVAVREPVDRPDEIAHQLWVGITVAREDL